MGLLREQKQLHKLHSEELEKKGEHPAKPKHSSKIGQIASRKTKSNVDTDIKTDILSYKGLPIEDKRPIKATLVNKYKKRLSEILTAKKPGESLILNAYIIWLFDLGDIEGFLNLIDQAIAMGQKQTMIPNKDYKLLKLYWIMDWTAEQRDQGAPYEPYFSRVFESITDWKLPQKIKEGYWYFMFYSLLNQGEFEKALQIGQVAITHGAEIKTTLLILEKVINKEVKKVWAPEQRKFVKV